MNDNLSVKLVIYKKIVPGDLSKFTATSNIAKTGGGARDLRFSPAHEFFPKFEMMFPDNRNGVLYGYFYWNEYPRTEVQIHPPTKVRPNEIRIGRVHECIPDGVFPEDMRSCIVLLVLDDSDKVWPYFITEESLIHDNWHPKIRNNIINGLNAKRRANSSPMGYIDFYHGGVYTNGQEV